ncbi:MAG: hypothetical protein LBV12_13055 [Puniceicoccales bacterium]|nr:hypothetical protein [Puniceicoccales bacterium]
MTKSDNALHDDATSHSASQIPPQQDSPPSPTLKKRFWDKLGGDGFLVSLALHIILLVVALFWVVSVIITDPQEEITTFATGAGGGSGGDRAKIYEHRITPKNARNLVKTPNKITVKGASSSVALPDMPNMGMSAFESGALMGGSSKGLGGGSGGGEGLGQGVGRGNGRNMVSVFGITGFNHGGLSGNFYDLKQNSDGTPSDLSKGYENKTGIFYGSPISECWGFNKVLNTFFKRDWDTSILSQYFSSPENLTLTQLYIPPMSASEAPKAYNVADKVKASRWIAHYKGSVIAPKSGRVRFMGFCDDILVMRFNNKVILDSGYTNPSIDVRFGEGLQHGVQEKLYGSNDHFTSSQQGMRKLRCGPWVDVTKGRNYPVEVVIGETPGGSFFAVLFMEEAQSGSSKPAGKPVLFKISNTPLPEGINTNFYNDVNLSGGDWIWQPGKNIKSR